MAQDTTDVTIQPANQSTQTIILHSKTDESQQKTVTIHPQSIKVELTTQTDWPMLGSGLTIGLISIIATITAALFTYKIQRHQIHSKIADIRQKWLEDLRNAMADFCEHETILMNEILDSFKDQGKNYLAETESTRTFSAMVKAQKKIIYMLDVKEGKDTEKRLVQTSKDMVELLRNTFPRLSEGKEGIDFVF